MRGAWTYLRDVFLVLVCLCAVVAGFTIYWVIAITLFLSLRAAGWLLSHEAIERKLARRWRNLKRQPYKAPHRAPRS
jgi:hypothetical protein